MLLEKLLNEIQPFANNFPGIIMIHSAINNFERIVYMNDIGLEFLETNNEEIRSLGMEYYVKYFDQIDMENIRKGMLNFMNEKDIKKHYTFFQRARPNKYVEWSWFLVSMKIYSFNVSGDVEYTISTGIKITHLNSVTYKLEKVLQELKYSREEKDRFNLLTLQEKNILTLVAEGKSSGEIAELLFISIHTVNTHRKNILQKLEFTNQTEIIEFARLFNLI